MFSRLIFIFGRTSWHAELPRTGIEPLPRAVEAWSLNYWTTREASIIIKIFFLENLFFPWPCWVFLAVCRLPAVAASSAVEHGL